MSLMMSAAAQTSDPTAAEDLSADVGYRPSIVDPDQREGVVAMYGPTFPLLKAEASEDDWVTWAESLWERHTASMQAGLHMIERNRLFRKGVQWISSVGMGPWREPERPRDSARIVENVIAPALDQRMQLVAEQRPGFRVPPKSADPQHMKKAEARQLALEFQYHQQQMSKVLAEAEYWAGTDGCAFIELFWDTNKGQWHEAMGVDPMSGQPQPLGPDGQPAATPHRFPLGDISSKVRRVEQVRVSADAKATKAPWYVVIREAITRASAAKEFGTAAVGKMTAERPEARLRLGTVPAQRLGYLLPEEEELLREQEIVDRITVYCDKSEYLEQGLTLVVVGRTIQYVGPLTYGCIPVVRMTDGSTDPAYFPQAIMNGWIDSQMRINAVKSKWTENVRLNAGPRLIAKENAIVGETLVGGTMSVIGVKGLGPINEAVKPLQGFSLAPDALEYLASEYKAFESISGWNDVSRGSFSQDQSGRAILAIRETLERIFAPVVNAAAEASADWAKKSLYIMKWGYDLPRAISVEGKSRIDLARSLTSEDFDDPDMEVHVDPETMMPMPRSLQLFLLKDMFQMGLMSPMEYRRRLPFAWIRSMGSADEDQEARGKRCAEALRSGQMLPILWQDNEAIHQDILERELILPDDTDQMIRQMAIERWNILGQQAEMKGAMPIGPSAPAPHGPPPPGMGAQEQPFAGTNPSTAAQQTPVPGTPSSFGGQSDQQGAAQRFEQSQVM